jgi:hypothetical protein
MELFAFLQAELAEDKDAEMHIECLFSSSSLGVFPRDLLLRLGRAPPSCIAPFDESLWFPVAHDMPWRALEVGGSFVVVCSNSFQRPL